MSYTKELNEALSVVRTLELEINAGLAQPQISDINALIKSELCRPPVYIHGPTIYGAMHEGTSLTIGDEYPFYSACGELLGIHPVVNQLRPTELEPDFEPVERLVLGALVRVFHSNTLLWAPIDYDHDYADVRDFEDEFIDLEDIRIAIHAEVPDIVTLIKTIAALPASDYQATTKRTAYLKYLAQPADIISAVYTPYYFMHHDTGYVQLNSDSPVRHSIDASYFFSIANVNHTVALCITNFQLDQPGGVSLFLPQHFGHELTR